MGELEAEEERVKEGDKGESEAANRSNNPSFGINKLSIPSSADLSLETWTLGGGGMGGG